MREIQLLLVEVRTSALKDEGLHPIPERFCCWELREAIEFTPEGT